MTATAVTTGRLYSFGLAALVNLLTSDDHSPEAEFLRSVLPGVSLDDHLADPAPADRLLLKLAQVLSLSRLEILVTSLAMAVETDLMCGRALAHLQAPVGGSRPTLGLLAAALSDFAGDGNAVASLLAGAAVQSGLLQVGNAGTPLAERPVFLPVPLCLALDAVSGCDVAWPGTTLADRGSRDVPLPPTVLTEAKKQALGLSSGMQRTLAIRTGSVAEGRAVACEIANALGRRALFIDVDKVRPPDALLGLGPWLLLRQTLPVFLCDLAPGERKAIPAIPCFSGPQLALCGLEGSLEADGGTIPGWNLGIASREERIALWNTALGNMPLALELSSHRHGSGRIAQLGRLARFQSALDDRTEPRVEDIVAASWTAEGAGLEALAQPLRDLIADDALVMTPGLRDELARLLLRCRGREGLVEGLGASSLAKYRPGVRALFTGPSGTGKTLAAGWLATRLALPLYRVDLAAVTSKYIGETEKNLSQLLARAEHAEVILLFDEADSMFGKRTELKESNDRFANAQTNYLLQRIESFDGIVFLTSNSRARFDPAFFRRLDAIIEFPVPGPMERRMLWQSHLGTDHSLTQRELNQLSAAADLLGGNIRNAVLTASLLARDAKRAIGYVDLLRALSDEYRKLGRQLPSELQSPELPRSA